MKKMSDYEREIDLRQLLLELTHKIKRIIMIGILMAALLAGYKFITADATLTQETQITYQPTTDYVGSAKVFLGSNTDTATAEAIRTYLTGNDVLQNVISDLKLELDYNKVFSMINLQNSTDTLVLITVIGKEEELVQNITNSLANIGSRKISETFNKDEVILAEPAYTQMRQYNAEISEEVPSNNKLVKQLIKYSVIGFVLGALLAAGVYLVLFMMDSTIRDEKDVQSYLDLPVLGTIPSLKGTRKYVDKGKGKKKRRLTQYFVR